MDAFLKRSSWKAAPPPPPGAKRPRTAQPKPASTTESGSKFVQCPVCSKNIAMHLINSHLDSCATETPPPAAAPPPVPPQAPQAVPSKTPPAPQPGLPPPTPPTAPVPHLPSSPPPPPAALPAVPLTVPPAAAFIANTPVKGPDAFSLMKQGAAAQRTRMLHATLLPGPLTRVAWSSCAAVEDDGWTARVPLRGAPKVELVLRQLVTPALEPGSAPPTIHPAAATLHGLGLGPRLC